MVLCPIIGHCDICYWVFAFVCATQLSDDVIAHSRAGLAPFSFALWLPTADSSHQHLWCVMAGAQTRPPGLCEEQSRRCAHTSDRCTRCHYPPLIIILPVLVILRASLAFYPAWLQNSCSLIRIFLSCPQPPYQWLLIHIRNGTKKQDCELTFQENSVNSPPFPLIPPSPLLSKFSNAQIFTVPHTHISLPWHGVPAAWRKRQRDSEEARGEQQSPHKSRPHKTPCHFD